ncbi:hypothetical protein GCM10025770_05050 [Viridibacterium curvum]|uniref:Uncharacterized protein n=1 Tax=Viridibacterium curvum TaxID=1101404 RepID=A0ABP9QBF3_9RHOO
MHGSLHEITQLRVDESMSGQRTKFYKARGNDGQAEMAATTARASVACMQVAVITDFQPLGFQNCEPFPDQIGRCAHEGSFGRYRAMDIICATQNTKVMPMLPTLKLTQVASE